MADKQHELFGKISYDADNCVWHGRKRIATLAAYDVHYGGASETEMEELDARQRRTKPTLEEREQDAERKRFRQGIFPFEIEDSTGAGPSPQQETAMREFLAGEADIVASIMKAIFTQYRQSYDAQPDWFKMFPKIAAPNGLKRLLRCNGFRISEYHLAEVAYIGLSFHCAWDEEHGLGVLWHKDHVVEVGGYDTLSNIPDAENFPEDIKSTPYRSLMQAICLEEEDKVQKLLAEGADINAFGKGDEPPVHTAIFYHNPGIVKRMLELGANPNLKDSEGRTALQVAELFASTGGLDHDGSTLLRVLVFVARIFNWRHFREVRLRMGEISKLLRQHGAK